MIDHHQKARLEGNIDEFGLAKVLEALAEIAKEKADHIRANGGPGDWLLADTWENAAAEIMRCSSDGDVQRVTP